MNRRNFLKSTLYSAAGVMLSEPLFALIDGKKESLNLPDKISALIDGKEFSIPSTGIGSWRMGDVELNLSNNGKAITVFIIAPGVKLSNVTLSWKTKRNEAAKVLNDQWERTYGDVSWHTSDESEILPWYFLEYDGKNTNAFGVKTGAAAFCFWKISNDKISLCLDTRSGTSGVKLGSRELKAAEIVSMKSDNGESPFAAARKFMKLMCDKSRLPKEPVYGINDWYFSYGKNSAKLIMEHTNLIAPLADGLSNRPFSVIDAGWYKGRPSNPDDLADFGNDMATPNEKFGDMLKLAREIKSAGMRPGLWTRPLCASYKDADWLLMPLSRGESKPILDPSIPENLERVRNYFKLYNDWGYELVKFDFTSFDIFGKWGISMLKDREMCEGEWTMYDQSKTNAEIVLTLYNTIREAAGSIYIIGCNTFSHLSAGLFELSRTGDDTSGREWGRTLKMGVNTLAFRGIHHNIFYASDADCVGLTNLVPWDKNKQWMELIAESGTPLFISAQPDAVGTEQKSFIKECFKTASGKLPVGEPIDWIENPLPSTWKLNGKIRKFDW